jgi:hypothetical protein
VPALITELIESQTNRARVRDQIGAILLVELANQQTLATAASEDPRLWALRVYLERANPWEEFIDAPDQLDAPPIVNVAFDNVGLEMAASNTVERQKGTAVYNIDCYGYGVSADVPDGGHELGDEQAAIEAERASGIVQRILMAGAYTYLGFARGANQVVWRRWVQSVTSFQPQIDSRPVPRVQAVRVALQVEFSEFSPQVQGQPLELIHVSVKRKETGELYFAAQYGEEDS